MKNIFGFPECKQEVARFGEAGYQEVFFDETPFNEPSLDEECYLIVGRRGSGKSALAHYFSFQTRIPNASCIRIEEPELYREFIHRIEKADQTLPSEVLVPWLTSLWSFAIWSLLFEHFGLTRGEARESKAEAAPSLKRDGSADKVLLRIIHSLASPRSRTESLLKRARTKTEDAHFAELKAKVLKRSANAPVIVAIDTLEKYDITNIALMNTLSALVHCVSQMCDECAGRGVYVKVFLPGEIFPYLEDRYLLNPTKVIRNPEFLLWRPRDLLRLICWRFVTLLGHRRDKLSLMDQRSLDKMVALDWKDSRKVYKEVWVKFFGEFVQNSQGIREETWSYVLRHTQMRPRQLITICNSIAEMARREDRFLQYSEKNIRDGIADAEIRLAGEILNSYSEVFPNVDKIVDALTGAPKILEGRTFDSLASRSRPWWDAGMYSLDAFRQVLADVGVIGVLEPKSASEVHARFSYAIKNRLHVMSEDTCVIHPMFYERLRIVLDDQRRVYPFSAGALSDVLPA